MSEKYKGLYGRGWAFPPDFDTEQGALMVSDVEDIHQSMQILFSTLSGERVMRRGYGCDLHAAVFENINDDLIASLTANITDAVLRYEQRVVLDQVEIAQDRLNPSMLGVHVSYRIRGTDALMRLTGQLDIGEGRGGMFS